MSLRIIFKGRVLIYIIIITTITCAGIIYTSVKSLQLDQDHFSLLVFSKNIDLEISHSRIFLDDYFLFNDTLKRTTILSSFSKTNQFINALDSLIEKEYSRKRKLELLNSTKSLTNQIKQLQDNISISLKDNTKTFNVAILNNYHGIQTSYQQLQKRIEYYTHNENTKFKKRVFALVFFTFFLLLICIFFIYRIINSYNAIEKQQAIRSLEVEFKERKRIAADLHDGLGSILSSIALFSKLIEKDCSSKTENKNLLQIKELSGIALENLEAIINNINPTILNKYGLIKSLEIICDRINNSGEVSCTVNSSNFGIKLAPDMELNIYRICNELINNTLKHAGASKLYLDIQQVRKTVTILYRDNGKGFNPNLIYTSEDDKMGLRNIISRTESFDGKYEIKSSDGKGVEILISFYL